MKRDQTKIHSWKMQVGLCDCVGVFVCLYVKISLQLQSKLMNMFCCLKQSSTSLQGYRHTHKHTHTHLCKIIIHNYSEIVHTVGASQFASNSACKKHLDPVHYQ